MGSNTAVEIYVDQEPLFERKKKYRLLNKLRKIQCPEIRRILDCYCLKDCSWLVMEPIKGESCADLV
jgi:hypothetical protein